jgi:hypothetical protein
VWSAVGVNFLFQLQNFQNQLERIKTETSAINGRITKLEEEQNQLAATDKSRSDDSLKPTGLKVSDTDIQTIRQFIKVAPSSTNARPLLKIGDTLPRSASLPLPEPVLEQIPKLRGARFAIDKGGAITITDAKGDHVAFIIDPVEQAADKLRLPQKKADDKN